MVCLLNIKSTALNGKLVLIALPTIHGYLTHKEHQRLENIKLALKTALTTIDGKLTRKEQSQIYYRW